MTYTFQESARELLRANDRGDFTVPSAHLYPHQWAWDSAFAAIGWSTFDPARGLREMQSLFSGQWDDGRIPHIRFSEGVTDYFPGPETWSAGSTSSISNPPMWIEAMVHLERAGCDRQALLDLLPAADRSLQFFADQRDPLGIGAVAVAHPWESGQDNSPAWDPALGDIDPKLAPPFKRVDVHKVADPGMRPPDDHYRRYIVIVRGIHDRGFGLGPFAVYDPFMTAVVMRAERHLADLAGRLGGPPPSSERVDRLAAGLDRLWSKQHQRYGFLDANHDTLHCPDILSCYAPLWTDALSLPRRRTLVSALEARYLSVPWPLPSTCPADPSHDPRLYWRGPSWISTNWLFGSVPEIAERVRLRTLDLIERTGFWEYFHPQTGDGLGADRFTWTAALGLELTAR